MTGRVLIPTLLHSAMRPYRERNIRLHYQGPTDLFRDPDQRASWLVAASKLTSLTGAYMNGLQDGRIHRSGAKLKRWLW